MKNFAIFGCNNHQPEWTAKTRRCNKNEEHSTILYTANLSLLRKTNNRTNNNERQFIKINFKNNNEFVPL